MRPMRSLNLVYLFFGFSKGEGDVSNLMTDGD